MKADICPGCGNKYQGMGRHWHGSPDHRPDFTQEQKEIITGLLMGDASIDRQSKNPLVVCQMITEEYLDYLDSKFGCLSTGVKLYKRAEEQASRNRKSGFSESAKAENYSDIYQWKTRTHPDLQEFADWYSSGKKVFPHVDLTPTVLKTWYVCDGYKDINNKYLVMSISNEGDQTDKIDSLFESADLPTPQYDYMTRKDGTTKCNARWSVSDSKQLLEYMDEPLPGFEYKWAQ